jgi:hypothetical protein
MFDSIFLHVKCPYCGQTSEMECQTKELDFRLERWRKGDNTGHPEVSELTDCFVSCKSLHCPGTPRAISWYQPPGDKSFTIVIDTPLGLITGKYRIVGLERTIDEPSHDPGP